MKLPVKGQEIYVNSSFYIANGQDDFCGGLATIDKVIINNKTTNEYNRVFVTLEEGGGSYNYKYLMEHQEEWKNEYGDQIAHECPEGEDIIPPIRLSKDEDFIEGLKEAIESGKDVDYAVDEDFNEYAVGIFDTDLAVVQVLSYLEKTLRCQRKTN